jgi:hypothetical protein
MAVIGATELQPVNILGSYIQGLEGGRAARAQRLQEATALAQAQRDAELRNYLATADLSSLQAQNELLRYGKSGADIAKTLGEMGTQRLTRQKTELEIKDAERKAKLDASGRLTSMLRSALKKPEDYPVLLRMAEAQGYDISEAPPTFDATWLNSKLAETLGVEKILQQEDREAQAKRDAERLGLERQRVGLERERVGISRASEERQAAEATDRKIVARTETDAAGNVTFYNKFGEKIKTETGAGKPSATFEKTKATREQTQRDISSALTTLKEVAKPGGLIDQSTGSGIGRGVDIAAGFFGQATPGAIAIGKLQPLADQILKIVPRFEGPQSDKDTQSYREASGQLANPTLPTEIRKAAANTLIDLFTKRQGQFTLQGAELETSPNIQAILDKYK